jgi:hypothetical protein
MSAKRRKPATSDAALDQSTITRFPRQGKQIDVQQFRTFRDEDQAKIFFEVIKSRLIKVNEWDDMSGKLLAKFQLTDMYGDAIDREIENGDFIRIDISGQGSTSEACDWVVVEDIEERCSDHEHILGFRLRPTSNPKSLGNEVAHFYAREYTSNFYVARHKNILECTITDTITDSNTMPNEETIHVSDQFESAVVGTTATIHFSELQWEHLADGILHNL